MWSIEPARACYAMQVQLKALTPANPARTPKCEFSMDVRCYRKLRRKGPDGMTTKLVKYSYGDCDVVVVVIQKPPGIPEAEEPSTFLIIPKDLLVAGGCMASETESQGFRAGSLEDHPEHDGAEKMIPVGTEDFLAGPAPMCSEFHPMSLGTSANCHQEVVNAPWKCAPCQKVMHAEVCA